MGKVIMSGIVPQLTVPSAGTPISAFAEGSIVKVNENGSPVEFYIAKHDYESSLNGAGRTLLVRKDCYDRRQWDSSNENAYAVSTINTWLNKDYKGLLDANIQEVIGTTKFRYTPGKGNSTVTTLERAIFLLSLTEYGLSYSLANVEGSALNIASTLRIAYLNGSATEHSTRTPYTDRTAQSYFINQAGNIFGTNCNYSAGVRPAFTLPSTIRVKDDGTVKGAA